MGYFQACSSAFITGVDIAPQKRYPFEFVQADWLEYLVQHGHEYDFIHASPPCQSYSVSSPLSKGKAPRLIPDVRKAIQVLGKPYVIENVSGAKSDMILPLVLRGNMFGLGVIRDRLFECSPWILGPATVPPDGTTNSHRSMSTGGKYICVAGNNFYVNEARVAMGIDWMSGRELAQAIPPAYTKFIGEQIFPMI